MPAHGHFKKFDGAVSIEQQPCLISKFANRLERQNAATVNPVDVVREGPFVGAYVDDEAFSLKLSGVRLVSVGFSEGHNCSISSGVIFWM